MKIAEEIKALETMGVDVSRYLLLPILATVLIARGVSGLVCRVPIYRGLAELLMVPAVAPSDAGDREHVS